MLYLDNNATTRPSPAAVEAAREAMVELWENPSSVHRAGQQVRARVELARQSIATLIGAKPRELVLTSSGTEAVHLAIQGVLGAARSAGSNPPLLVTSPVEHSAGRELAKELEGRGDARLCWLAVDRDGVVDVSQLERLLEAGERPALVSVQWANNETGVVQPVERLAAVCNAHGVPFHCDAVQWVGKEPTKVGAGGLDCALLSLSAHKFHGLKGCGALYIRRGVRLRPVNPGTQELGRRAGTESVPSILAAGAAAAEAHAWLSASDFPDQREALLARRDRFERRVLEACPGASINGGGAPRLWNTSNIGFPRLEAEAILLALSERGLCASAGAACASGSLEPSPVLLAMGLDPAIAHGSVRLSLCRQTTEAELDRAVEVLASCVAQLRSSTSAAVGDPGAGGTAAR